MADLWYYLGACFSLGMWLVCWRILSSTRFTCEHSCCAFCGYFITGLSTSICPECGKDLTIVGVRQPSRLRHIAPETRLLLMLASFTIAFWVAMWSLWNPFHERLQPGTYYFCDQVTLTPTGSERSIVICRAASVYCWPWERGSMLGRITPSEAWLIASEKLGFGRAWGPMEILEGHLVTNRILPQELMHRSLKDLPQNLQRHQLFDKIVDRFWVDCKTPQYGWSDSGSKDYFYRSGPYTQDLNTWLATWASRSNVTLTPAQLHNVIGIALAAPFLGAQSLPYPGFKSEGSGWGFNWEASNFWGTVFWLPASLAYVLLLLLLIRRSTWYRGKRSLSIRQKVAPTCAFSPGVAFHT